MRKSELIALGIIALTFLVGIYFYPQMPERIATHWNAAGEVDGYRPKSLNFFFMPALSLVLLLVFIAIPRIDPLKANIEVFRPYYDVLVVLITVFLSYLFFLTIAWNLGLEFNLMRFLAPGIAILFYYAGILVEHAKRNWFIGIRTPWTLSSDVVWEKTHKIGGKLFKLAGVVSLLSIIFPSYAIFFITLPIIAVAVYTIVYSYFEYQKQTT